MYSLPPMARNSFLLASTSFAAMCQWPIVAPASLYGASCADAAVATSVEATVRATSRELFMPRDYSRLRRSAFRPQPHSNNVLAPRPHWLVACLFTLAILP